MGGWVVVWGCIMMAVITTMVVYDTAPPKHAPAPIAAGCHAGAK